MAHQTPREDGRYEGPLPSLPLVQYLQFLNREIAENAAARLTLHDRLLEDSRVAWIEEEIRQRNRLDKFELDHAF